MFLFVQVFLIRSLVVEVYISLLHSSNSLITNAYSQSQTCHLWRNSSRPLRYPYSANLTPNQSVRRVWVFTCRRRSPGQRTMAIPYSIFRFCHKHVVSMRICLVHLYQI